MIKLLDSGFQTSKLLISNNSGITDKMLPSKSGEDTNGDNKLEV